MSTPDELLVAAKMAWAARNDCQSDLDAKMRRLHAARQALVSAIENVIEAAAECERARAALHAADGECDRAGKAYETAYMATFMAGEEAKP